MALYLPLNNMKKVIFLLFILSNIYATAQDSTNDSYHGTIKVKNKGILHSVIYDDVNFRLVCKDIYGNIIDTAVASFDVNVTIKGIAYSEKTAGSFLSKPMQQRLSRLDGITTLMFSNVKAKEKNGMLVSFPDFKAYTGNAREKSDY
jgi:hypothetical protein